MNVEHAYPTIVDGEAPTEPSAVLAWARKRRWFVLTVLLPTFLAAIYYGFFASDIYVSEARFVIKSPDQKRAQITSLASLIQTTGLSGGDEQANEILAYVRSRSALKALEQNVGNGGGIRAKFAASSGADPIARFPHVFQENSFENLFQYYEKMVDARLDTATGTAVITTQAFTAKDAYELNRQLLALSEALVNRLNTRARVRTISEAQRQVDLATERARRARVALAGYRNREELIDPAKQATGVLEIADALIGQRTMLQARLDQMQRITPANPTIPALRARIDALTAQIDSQDDRVVGSSTGIASKLGGYENLVVEQQFATQNLTVANAALVQARADADRQQFYLERVVDPTMPDMPLLPHRFLNVIIVAATATCLYFIGWMFIVGILEHAPEE